MQIKIYYIHSYDIDNRADLYTDGELDHAKVKQHPKVLTFTLDEFINKMNAVDIDGEGAFAYDMIDESMGDWSLMDITEHASTMGYGVITDAVALEIREYINHKHDATIGVNWDTIEFAIEQVLGELPEEPDDSDDDEPPYVTLNKYFKDYTITAAIDLFRCEVIVFKDGSEAFSAKDATLNNTDKATFGFAKQNEYDWYFDVLHTEEKGFQLHFYALKNDIGGAVDRDQDQFITPRILPTSLEQYGSMIKVNINLKRDAVEVFNKETRLLIYDTTEAGLAENEDQYFGWEDQYGSWDLNVFLNEDNDNIQTWSTSLYKVNDGKINSNAFTKPYTTIIQ
jgi:hypothetical protein